MKKVLLPLLIALAHLSYGQENPYAAFENLIGGKWETKGKWANGTEYHQHLKYEWALTKKIIIAKTFDFIDSKQFDDSLRNFGARAWNEEKKLIEFHDYNVFGGIVSGTVICSANDIFYAYEYLFQGKSQIFTDAWIYKDKNTYEFKVGFYKDGKWEKVFLSSEFKRISD